MEGKNFFILVPGTKHWMEDVLSPNLLSLLFLLMHMDQMLGFSVCGMKIYKLEHHFQNLG